MQFGLMLPMIGRIAGAEAIDAVCAKAENEGLDSLWVVDHVLLPYSIGARYPYNLTGEWMIGTGPWWDAFSVMSYAAARTERITLGTGVIVLPYRHPVHTAKIVATIDQLSRGRVIFGVGVGWMEDEFRNLGLDSFHHRGALVNEQIDVFREVWANDPASFAGRYYDFESVSVTPQPYQRPHPPLLVGGNSDGALRRAAERGDGWFSISLRPRELAEHRERMARFAAAAGRDAATLDVAMLHGIRLTDDPDERGRLPAHERRQAIVGTLEQVIEELHEFAAAGLSHIVASVRRPVSGGQTVDSVLEGIEILTREIAPALR